MVERGQRPPGLPLEGLRVLEMGEYVAAPLTGMALADLGADVIKVERPAGDPHRNFGFGPPGSTMAFVNCNRNKRGIVLDLKQVEDRDRYLKLVARSDVLLCSIRPKAMAALDLSDDQIAEANPSVLRLYFTGYGLSGPRSLEPAYDALLQSVTGLAYVQGGGVEPELLHTFMADKVTAMLAVQSVLAALHGPRESWRGGMLAISLLDAVAYFNFSDLFTRRTEWIATGPDLDGVTLAMRPIRTKDGWILISPVSGSQIGRAFKVIGHPEYKEVLKELTERAVLARKLVELLETATPSESTEHWLERLREADVPASPVLTIDEHLADSQVVYNEIYGRYADPVHGDLRDVKYPVDFPPGQRVATRRPAPGLGEHTDEVLHELT